MILANIYRYRRRPASAKKPEPWLEKLLTPIHQRFSSQALRFAGMFYFPKALCFAQKNICGNTDNLKQFVLSAFCD